MNGWTIEPRPPSDAGFTLIEMLVALALASVSVGILAGSVRSSRTVMAFIERNTAASAIVPAQSYLRLALAQAIPAQASPASTSNRTPVLIGEPDRISFNTFYAPRGQIAGLYQVEVRLEPVGGRALNGFDLIAIQTLLRSARSVAPDVPLPTRKSTLASNVQAVSIRYFGIDDQDPENWQWLQSWSSVERLPRLVQISVTFTKDQNRIWHRLEAPLQLSN